MKTIVVVGGGFFGVYLSEYFAREGHRVRLIEREPHLMCRASYANQARVHHGYHYPRSILTALRSRLSFPRFVEEFRDCIDSDFVKYYMIGTPLGKVSAQQFLKFCERIGAYCEPAPTHIRRLTNPNFIEACFSTVEYAFDATRLRNTMKARLDAVGVTCDTSTSVDRVDQRAGGLLLKTCSIPAGECAEMYADHVFNCTYSRINRLLYTSSLELIPLKHELTELCLVAPPEALRHVGITVMCGPFFSIMPFPPAALHSFSHVRYTPHFEWSDQPGSPYRDAQERYEATVRNTAWPYMLKDAARYIPILAECQYQSSLWEVKTVLPRSEVDDSRPILFRPHHELQGFHCVMGGKIDNVYDVVDAIVAQRLIN